MAKIGDDAFLAPSRLVQQHALVAVRSKKRRNAAGESLIADMLGLDPVPIASASVPKHLVDFLYATLHLYGSYYRFDEYRTVLRRYPWRGRVSRHVHLSICMHAILNECYVFEERLKKFFAAVETCAEAADQDFPRSNSSTILRSYHRSLISFLKARGVHTHQSDFVPRELDRISLIEMPTGGGEMKKLRFALPLALRNFRMIWLKNIDGAQQSIKTHMIAAFATTEHIWSRLAPQGKS
jgi:hypothetical protein